MPVKTANLTGKYLYAIIIYSENQTYTFEGIDGCPVYTISNGRIAAVVSDVKNEDSPGTQTVDSPSWGY